VEVRTEHQSIEGIPARVLEQVAPVLPGFGLNPRDCRQLSNPIDYIAFDGLSDRGVVDSLSFIDVKTGDARLDPHQQLIKEALVAGRIEWLVYEEDIS
jgi:predicted Holliday junction resolvase-like endonuclease